MEVVNEPAQESRTVSDFLVYVFSKYSIKSEGFCVGCNEPFTSLMICSNLRGFKYRCKKCGEFSVIHANKESFQEQCYWCSKKPEFICDGFNWKEDKK